MSGHEPNDPVQFQHAQFALMTRLDAQYEVLVGQGWTPQAACEHVRLKTGNHPWFPPGPALQNTGNPQITSLDLCSRAEES